MPICRVTGVCTRRWPPAYGQLGERDAAGKALQDLLKLRPDFAATIRKNIEKWWEPDYGKHLIDGWRKAGLEIPPTEGEERSTGSSAESSRPSSKAMGAGEGFWVAVLPFIV